MAALKARLQALPASALKGMRRGIEKESLRSRPDGSLAATPHPLALGSALTHPHITTDFSESQLELITGAHAEVDSCVDELTHIHQFVYRTLAAAGDEMLWVGSMPCGLPADENIPIGVYGTSNVARAKSVYRMGLGHRYGRRMQTISGIHYNWSLPGLGNEDYFGLIRNFRRHSFLLLYLFGASPAVCGSFVAGREHGLQLVRAPFDEARAHGRRGTEQHQRQEGVAAEVADQREVLFARHVRQRPVVVHARNGLHAAAVAVRQAHAVHALGAAHVGAAVARQRDGLVGGQAAGHAGQPHRLFAGGGQGAVGELVHLAQLGQAGVDVGMHAGDQLQLRFAEVGRDVRMRERAAQRSRMGREGQLAIRERTQTFPLDATAHALHARRRQRLQPLLQ